MATLQPDSIEGRGFKGGVRSFGFEPRSLSGDTLDYFRAAYAMQSGRLIIWAPVFLAIGIWTYFNLLNEPSWIAVAGLAVPVVLLFWMARRYSIAMLIGLVVLGFCLSKLRQEIIATPLLRAAVTSSEISGFIADADNRGGKKRVLVIELDSATNILPACTTNGSWPTGRIRDRWCSATRNTGIRSYVRLIRAAAPILVS